MIEPSDVERSEWKETTKDYVEELEDFHSNVTLMLKELEEQSQYHYGKHAGYSDAFERLNKVMK